MASGRAIDDACSAARLLSLSLSPWRLAFSLLTFVCYAGATEPPSPAAILPEESAGETLAPSTTVSESSVAGGGGGGSSALEVVAIVCGVIVGVGVGTALLCCYRKNRKDKRRRIRNKLAYGSRDGWRDSSKVGEGQGGGGGGGGGALSEEQRERMGIAAASRSASLALMVAPFEGGQAWHEAEDEQGLDLELGRGGGGGDGGDGGGGRGRGLRRLNSGSTIGPRFDNPLYEARMNRTAALGRLTGAAATASPSAAGDDPEDDGDGEEEGEEEEKAMIFIGGDRGDGDSGGSRGGAVGASQGKAATTTTTPSTTGSRSVLDRDSDGGGGSGSGGVRVGGMLAAEATTSSRRLSAPSPIQAYHNPDHTGNDDVRGDEDYDDYDAVVLPRRRSQGDNNSSGRAGRRGGVRVAPSPASLATSAVLKVAEGVVAGVRSLAPLEAFVPGAREALSVVAGLARLAAADHRGDTKDMRQRLLWCRGVVLTLDKARVLLGKATADDLDPKRVALEAVREPVERMVEIVQAYKNKHMVSDVFFSSLFWHRLAQAQEAVLLAERHQTVLEREDVEHQGETVEAILAKASQTRRQRRSVLLDQVDIPAASLDLMEEEVLGLGGFGTVYLADLGGGINAAAKVVRFSNSNKPVPYNGGHENLDDDGDKSSDNTTTATNDYDNDCDNDNDNDNNNGNGVGQQRVGEGGSTEHASAAGGEQEAAGGGGGGGGGGRERRGAWGRHEATQAVQSELALEPIDDQKARRGAVVAKAKRAASEQRLLTRERVAFCRELEAMKRLRGANTVHTYGAVTTLGRNRLVLVMEFLPGGDLLQRLLKTKRPLQERVLRKIVTDVCSGMAFLHREAFVHGDLKSANVLFDAEGTAKIGDLGTSLWTQCTNRVATYSARPGGLMSLPWAAPEILRREAATEKSDVYSFGVVLWECLTRKVPWEGVTDVRTLYRSVRSGERPPVPADAPGDLAALARACWADDPADRPTLEAVLEGLGHGAVAPPPRAAEGGGEAPAAAAAAAAALGAS